MVETMAQTEESKVPAPKDKKLIITVATLVTVIILGVLGWGLYNGNRAQTFAKDSETMISKTNEWDKYFDSTSNDTTTVDYAEYAGKFRSFETEAKANAVTVSNKNVPSKAKDLQNNVKEYYTLIADLAAQMAEFMTQLEQMMAQYQGAYDSLSNGLGADETMSQAELEALATEASSAMSAAEQIDESTLQEMEKTSNEIEQKANRIQELEKTILTQIGELKSIKFLLY